VVTGASSGIGAATARLLASKGASVVMAARRADRLAALAKELPNSVAIPTDITEPDQVRALVQQTVDTFGQVDVLVNNAGQGLHVPIRELKSVDLLAVFQLNVLAPLSLMQAVFPHMQAQSQGAIVNVSSGTSLRVFPGLGGYAATKSALNMLAHTARLEFADAGITVCTVYPSVTATEFHQKLRAGKILSGAWNMSPDPAELPAAAVAFAIETGESDVLVGDPPRPISPFATDPRRQPQLADAGVSHVNN